jgi:hypothetical protein
MKLNLIMSLLKRPPIIRMAPPGYHVVKRHARISKYGIKYFVKAHRQKNRGKNIVLLPENILYLYWHSDTSPTKLGKVKGFQEYPELDSVIIFWFNYWQEAGLKFPRDFDPFIVKIMIAVESSFRLKANPNVAHSSAYGLMQITNKTRRDTKNLNDGVIDIERKDLEDAVINIAVGIRWISYKFNTIPKKEKKNLFNTLRGYYHFQEGEPYAKKIMSLYNLSKL